MLKKLVVVLFILLGVSVSNAVETAERISDREIIESLATLKEGLKNINQRLDDFKESQKNLKEDMNSFKEDINSLKVDINSLRDFMTWGFGVIFVSMSSLSGFVLWDRRSALAPAVRKNKELEEREEKLEKALKRLAVQDLKLADALRYVGLM